MRSDLFAERIKGIQVSGIRKMFEAAPPSAINLGLGEPDFAPPENVMHALAMAVRVNRNKYGPTAGIPELRQAVAERLRKFREDVEMNNVLINCGATQGLMVTFQSLINRGDEVLVPNPGFVLYARDVQIARGTPVYYSLSAKNGFRPDMEELDDLVSPRTKAIVLNYPGNPTGAVISKHDAGALARFAVDNNIIVITDEVYDEIVYDHEHRSMLGTMDDLVYINSFSKTYSLTGWRIGYLATASAIQPELSKMQYYDIACPPTPMQYAALEAMKGPQDKVKERREEFRKRRDLIVRSLNKIDGFNCFVPQGAFYVFPSFDFDMTSEALAMRILGSGVICTPGSAFGPGGEGHIRFSFANSQENIDKAMDIVGKVVSGLKRK
ncbi:MAG: aminotransferase class I/II-fold pyridoxal phosphate-dependent enzyme [Euryarchaeota archaeon]|nr:aminotransferase class I/II-fold pyridoxal phosphate-dependent enzyme [Euryarchaeota archaeon]